MTTKELLNTAVAQPIAAAWQKIYFAQLDILDQRELIFGSEKGFPNAGISKSGKALTRL